MNTDYEVSEVRIEQWLLAALQMQRGLGLAGRNGHRARASKRTTPRLVAGARIRGSLWVMLAASIVGLCVL